MATLSLQALNPSRARLAENLTLVLVAAMWLFPFSAADQREPIATFENEWQAVMLGLLAAFVSLFTLGRENLRLPRMALAPLALLAFLGLQQLILPQLVEPQLQTGMAYLLWAVLLMILGQNLLLQSELQRIAPMLAFGLLLGGLAVTGQEFWFRYHSGFTHRWGGLAQRNLYNDYLCLALASGLYLWLTQTKHRLWYTGLLVLAAIIILAGLSLSPSRSIWLYALAAAGVASFGRATEKRRLLYALGLLALGFGFLQWLGRSGLMPPLPPGDVVHATGDHFFLEVEGAPMRLHLWRVALELFMQAPLLGHGFGQFDWAFFSAGQPFPGFADRPEYAHNLFLQLLVELGVIPVLLLSVLLVLWWRGFRKAEAGPEHGWLLMVLAILSLHSLIDNPLWHAHFLGIAAVVLGLGEQKTYPLQLNVFGKWTVGLVLLALLGLGLHERHNYKRLEHLVYGLQVGAFSFKQGEFISGISQVGQKAPLLEPYVGMLFTAVNEIKEGNNSPLLPVYEHALHFMPGPYLAYRDVLLLALADKPNEATVLLTQALNAYPAGAENLVKDLQSYSPAAQQKTGYLLEIIKAKGNEKPD